jgi:hypothetical protein
MFLGESRNITELMFLGKPKNIAPYVSQGSPRNISIIFLGQPRNIIDEYKIFFLKKMCILSASPDGEPPKQAYIYFSIHINKS